MKAIMVLIDGLEDEKIEELNFKTPFEYAKHKNLDALINKGHRGSVNNCVDGFLPDSLVCTLNLLGIDKEYFPTSRAYFELLSNGYNLSEQQVVMRCNLVSIDDNNKLITFNGGQLTVNEMREAAKLCQHISPDIKFIHLSGYRNLLVLDKKYFDSLIWDNLPPHEHVGENIKDLQMNIFQTAEVISDFVNSSEEILNPFNNSGQKYTLYPWGISEKSKLTSIKEIFGVKAAAICSAEVIKGIATSMGMKVFSESRFTADVNTDLKGKAETACNLLKYNDFVFVHINGADEASHRRDFKEKVNFIEKIDCDFFETLNNNLSDEVRILVCSDHGTSSITGKHMDIPVTYIVNKSEDLNIKNLCAKETLKYLLK